MAYMEVLISGFGGQGVMAIGKTLAEAGMKEGKNVSWLPSYGPEMRGGTANCGVVIADSEIISPIVLEPDMLVAMNQPSLVKFGPEVQKDGYIFINSTIVKDKVERDDVHSYYVPCDDIATEMGNQKVANMVMLGAIIAATRILSPDTIAEMLSLMFTGPKAHLVELNKEALKRGAACIQD